MGLEVAVESVLLHVTPHSHGRLNLSPVIHQDLNPLWLPPAAVELHGLPGGERFLNGHAVAFSVLEHSLAVPDHEVGDPEAVIRLADLMDLAVNHDEVDPRELLARDPLLPE